MVALGPEKFRFCGNIDSGAKSWKNQRSRRTGQICTGQVRIGQVGRAEDGLCQTWTGQVRTKSIFCKYLTRDTMIFGKY